MTTWYREHDLLPSGIEHIIPAQMPLDATVAHVMAEAGLTIRA